MSETIPAVREAPDRVPPGTIRELMDEPPAPAAAPLGTPPEPQTEAPEETLPPAAQAAPPATEAPEAATEQGGESAAEEAPQTPEAQLAELEASEDYGWLDEPDETDVTEAELHADPEPEQEPDEFGYTETPEEDDPRILEERRKRIAAEKRIAHIEGLRAQEASKAWKAEAVKAFPLSAHAVDSIGATSRKEFLREARAHHEQAKELIDRYAGSEVEVRQAAAEEAKTQARAEAEAAWGKVPGSGPGIEPASARQQQELDAAKEIARKGGGIKKLILAMANQDQPEQ